MIEDHDSRRSLAFQIAAQLPSNLEDAMFVLGLAAELVRFAVKRAAEEGAARKTSPTTS